MQRTVWATLTAAVLIAAGGCQTTAVDDAAPVAATDAAESDVDEAGAAPLRRGLPEGIAVAAPESSALSRGAWEPLVVGPVDGRTYHRPIYFTDYGTQPPQDITWATPQAAFEQVVQDDTMNTLSPAHLAALVGQPAKFVLDLVLLPVHAVITPPWRTVTTPPTP